MGSSQAFAGLVVGVADDGLEVLFADLTEVCAFGIVSPNRQAANDMLLGIHALP